MHALQMCRRCGRSRGSSSTTPSASRTRRPLQRRCAIGPGTGRSPSTSGRNARRRGQGEYEPHPCRIPRSVPIRPSARAHSPVARAAQRMGKIIELCHANRNVQDGLGRHSRDRRAPNVLDVENKGTKHSSYGLGFGMEQARPLGRVWAQANRTLRKPEHGIGISGRHHLSTLPDWAPRAEDGSLPSSTQT